MTLKDNGTSYINIKELELTIREMNIRVLNMEGRMLVVENCVKKLEQLPELITSLRETVAGMKAQTKITWALMSATFLALIGLAFAIIQAGILSKP